jgi:predicted nucleotidyltransferase
MSFKCYVRICVKISKGYGYAGFPVAGWDIQGVHGGGRGLKTAIRYHDVEVAPERIAGFCRRWKIREFSLFGSVLGEDFSADSDIDVLVTFEPEAGWSFGDLLQMEEELEALFHHPVDLVERHVIEQSPNYIRRKHILTHLESIYVA